ncbi:MAG: peptidylprolyl isomerase [Deltaproteobacteria bacterium]
MKLNSLFLLIGIATTSFLNACGGGGGTGSESPVTTTPSVSAITIGKVVYKKGATFTVTGENLHSGITANAIGCSGLAEQPGGTDTSRIYSCVPWFPKDFLFTISASAGGTTLKQISVPVPLPQVTLVTSMGTIVVELRPDRAKATVDNFLQYVNDGFYDNTIFHRVVSGFVVQGGGYSVGQTTLKPTRDPIILEAPSTTGLSNIQGAIAMARTTGLNSATSQFFIDTVDNRALDSNADPGAYAVFGSVIQGMDIVKAIEIIAVDSSSWPTTEVIVTSAKQTDTVNK